MWDLCPLGLHKCVDSGSCESSEWVPFSSGRPVLEVIQTRSLPKRDLFGQFLLRTVEVQVGNGTKFFLGLC